MNLNRLTVFHAAARLLSFTRAADELCLTQPAISKHIKELENHYNARLFDRLGKKIILTQAGEILLRATTEIFRLADDSKQRIDDLTNLDGGRLAIGADITIGTYLLPDLLVKFRQMYPRIDITVDVARSRQLVRAVLANTLELGLVGHFEPDERLASEIFITDRLELIVSPQHPWAARTSSVRLEELAGQPFLLSTPGSGTWRNVKKLFDQAGITLSSTLEMGTSEGVKQAVAANLGIALLSHHVVAGDLSSGRLCSVHLAAGDISRDFYLVHQRERYLSAASRAFIGLLGLQRCAKHNGRAV